MSEQPTIKLPVENGPTPDADAFLKKELGKQSADDDAAKAAADKATADKAAADKVSADQTATDSRGLCGFAGEFFEPVDFGLERVALGLQRVPLANQRVALGCEICDNLVCSSFVSRDFISSRLIGSGFVSNRFVGGSLVNHFLRDVIGCAHNSPLVLIRQLLSTRRRKDTKNTK